MPIDADQVNVTTLKCKCGHVRIMEGESELKAFRLLSKAATRRIVAACCNTPDHIEFKGGHWLSLYGGLWPEGALPRLDLRRMTSDLPEGCVVPDDVPNAR